MLKLNRTALLVILLCISLATFGQYEQIEKGYYLFPIMPDRTNYLSGNMSELRPSHFHAGLDIKTNGKEGYRVYAAAEGYISRIRIGPGGYGNTLYINHPNGTTTVYAHLMRMKDPAVVQYILAEHYQRKTHALNLFPDKGQFKVKRGDVIAISGNTGSSTGPHLHFEIRTANQEVLDPLKIGFSEIKDNINPTPASLAIKTMDIDSRVNGQFGYATFGAKRLAKGEYKSDTIYGLGRLGLELYCYDKHNGASNRNGVPEIDLYLNGQRNFSQNIDTINFATQKNVKVHTNYQSQKLTRRRYGKLYIDKGNPLDYYTTNGSGGLVELGLGDTVEVRVELRDAYDNTSDLQFVLIGSNEVNSSQELVSNKQNYLVQDNTLMFHNKEDKVIIMQEDGGHPLDPAYQMGDEKFYLVDLKRNSPQALSFGEKESVEFNFSNPIPAADHHTFVADTYSLEFGKNSLFDTVYIRSKHEWTTNEDILTISEDLFPLKGSVNVSWQPQAQYDSLSLYQVYQINGNRKPIYIGGKIEDEVINFRFSSFGKFTLLKDEKKPRIRLISSKNNRVTFRIKDDLSGIKSFKAKINGEWLLMHYEPKKDLIWSERLNKNKDLIGEFELIVSDNADNKSVYKLKLGEL